MTVQSADREALERELRRRLSILTVVQKVRLLSGQDQWRTYEEPAIGLRAIVCADSMVGVRGVRWSEADPSANTPSATAIAATFDPAVAEEAGRLVGAEAHRKGIDVILGPVVNLQRSPYSGRNFEGFGEDPQLSAELATAMVRGMQAEGAATTVKHFIANEAETDRMTSNSVVDEQVLREVYLRPFEAVVTAASGHGVMSAYNSVNGTLASDTPLLMDVLKAEWGFDGVVVSDWNAIRDVIESAHAGTDLAMPGPDTRWADGLVAAVEDGQVSESAIDAKALRLLRLAARVGALEGIAPLVDRSTLPAPRSPDAPRVRRALRRIASLGSVLLRNEGALLPLDTSALRRIAVIGPAATVPRINGGGSAAVIPPAIVTPLEAIASALPMAQIVHAEGARPGTLLAPLTAEHGNAANGGGVLRVEFLDADGGVLGAELRDRPDSLVYGMGYPDGVTAERVASIRATTRLTVDADGDYLFAGAGVGHARITVDDRIEVDEELVPANTDAVIGMSRPPQATVPIAMRAREPVDVAFTFEPAPRTVAALRVGFAPAAPDPQALIAEAVAAACDAEVSVVLIGTGPEDESEGVDRDTLALSGYQDALVHAVAAACPRTVVVVNAGAPVLLPWRDEVAAILLPWFGGQEMGPAIAEQLVGDAEPGGRLPVTMPAREGSPLASPRPVDGDVVYAEGLDIGYRSFARAGRAPAYAFGHGLGYTSWELGPPTLDASDGPKLTFSVTNTGTRRGRCVAQAYCTWPDDEARRPAISYAGSSVVQLDPGEQVETAMRIPQRVLERWDPDAAAWVGGEEPVTIRIGTSSADIAHTIAVTPR